MLSNRRKLSTLLAALIALRALVPVGYMLKLPSVAAPRDFSIILCPMQNPGLDLSALTGGVDHHANHRSHHGTSTRANDGGRDLPSFGSGCGFWVNSANLVFDAMAFYPFVPLNTTQGKFVHHQICSTTSPRGHSLSRAPPSLS